MTETPEDLLKHLQEREVYCARIFDQIQFRFLKQDPKDVWSRILAEYSFPDHELRIQKLERFQKPEEMGHRMMMAHRYICESYASIMEEGGPEKYLENHPELVE